MFRGKNTKEIGKQGEEIAVEFLKKQGYRILERNWTTKFGEIDIIARDGHTLVFVEVKTRFEGIAGSAEASIDYRKRRSISRTALFFLQATGFDHLDCRFDVVTVEFCRRGQPRIEHIEDAFRVPA